MLSHGHINLFLLQFHILDITEIYLNFDIINNFISNCSL